MTLLATTRRALLGLVGSLAIFRPSRAEAPDDFLLQPQFDVGQRRAYRMDMRQRRQEAIAHHTRCDVQLEVVTQLQGGWVLCWTTAQSEVVDADPHVRPMLEALAGLWDGVPIAFVVDEQGRVEGLADPQSMRERVAASVDRLLDLVASDPARAPLRPHLHAALGRLMASDVLMIQMLLKEPMVLMGAMGRHYRVGEPLEVHSRIPSPLGSGEIPILGRFSVRGVDAAHAEAELGWLMAVDRRTAARHAVDDLAGPLQTLADAAGPARAVDAAALLDTVLDGLDFDERADFHVDTATAWPQRVHHVRRTVAGAAERIDSVELTQRPN